MSTETKAIDIVGLREELSKLTLDNLKLRFEELGIIDAYKNGANKQSLVEKGIKAYVELLQNTVKTEVDESQKPVEEKIEVKESEPVVPTTLEIIQAELSEEISEGEYDIDQDTLDDYPGLVNLGFNVGDVLVVEEGKPFSKKQVEETELKLKAGDIGFGTEGITTQKTIEEADAEIKEDNQNIKPEDITDISDVPGTTSSTETEDLVNGIPRAQVNEELAALNGGPVETTENEAEETESDEEDILDGNEVVKEYEVEVIDETKFTEEEILENIEICTANCSQAIPSTRIVLLRKIDALNLALERKRK